jgi:uncharacterized RDD family membrane protein YckC
MRSGASDPDGRLSQPRRVPSPDPPAYAYAGLASRLMALAVDVALLTIAGLFISVLPGLAWSQVVGDPPGWFTATCAIVASALPWAYFTVAWWLGGQTAGGLVVGTRVARTDGERPLLVQAALRAFVGLLLVPLWLIGLARVLFDPRRRAWHDVVFRTVVLRYVDPTRPAALCATTTVRSTSATSATSSTRGAVPAPGEQPDLRR